MLTVSNFRISNLDIDDNSTVIETGQLHVIPNMSGFNMFKSRCIDQNMKLNRAKWEGLAGIIFTSFH